MDNAYAYGESNIDELTCTYNHYALLFEDSEIGNMLKDFPGRYYDAMPKVEAAQAGGGVGFNVLTAVITGGAGAGVAIVGLVVSKASLFRKAKKIIDKILDLLEKKKKTPDAKISKQHNEVAQTKVDKTSKEEIKDKDKKKCKACGKDYNAKCPSANSKVKYPSDVKGTGGKLTERIVLNPKNDYKKIEDHPWFFKRQQGSVQRRSLEAHHLIVTESMKNPDFKEICKDFGYDINNHKNGVMLPYYMDLACHLGVPLHRGSHKKGETDIVKGMDEDGGEVYLNYPRAVKDKVASLSRQADMGGLCGIGAVSPRDTFISEINDISLLIFKEIRKYDWSISADGFDYKKSSPIGCGDALKIAGKNENSTCSVRSKEKKEHVHALNNLSDQPIKKNQISKLKIGY